MPTSDEEEIYDLSDSPWEPPQGDDPLEALLSGMPEYTTVSSSDLPSPGAGASVLPDDGGDREWL